MVGSIRILPLVPLVDLKVKSNDHLVDHGIPLISREFEGIPVIVYFEQF